MKKIGILTYHFSKNYGALYQAYALREYLISLGYDANFINYHPEHLEAGGTIKFNELFKKSGMKVLYLKVISLKEKLFGNKNINIGFKSFISEYLGVCHTSIKSIEALNNANLEFDYLICGSDQVWNPSEHFGVDPVYFLDFKVKNTNVKRISFAPSFGKSKLDAQHENRVSELINKLDHISIREKNGVNIAKKLTKKPITLVSDPTILISTYRKIQKAYKTKNKDFIFCYYLRSRDNVGEITEYISSKIGFPIYSPHNPHRRWREIGETIFPCPRQWLYMLNNSKLVITNSFHGTMLSILLNKPFIVPAIPGVKSGYNDRVLNLLEQCKLQNRFIVEMNKSNIDEVLETPIDWDLTNSEIAKMKIISTEFLKTSLK